MPRQSLDKANVLRSADLFKGLDADALEEIQACAVQRQLAPGTMLVEQGAEPTHLFVVASGFLKLGHLTPTGAQLTLGYRSRGSLVGCIAVMRPMAYAASAKAVEPTAVLGWTSLQLQALAVAHPILFRNALRTVCANADELLQRLRELTTEQVEQRVARALKRFVPPSGGRPKEPDPTPPLSRQDLAELTGATHFTVSRILSAWEEEGIIETRRPRLVIRDLGRLARIADGTATAGPRQRALR